MRNFKDPSETHKGTFISAFSICMTIPLLYFFLWNVLVCAQICSVKDNSNSVLLVTLKFVLQLNSCNSNSYNSKNHLNRKNSSVLSEFNSNPLQENSFNSDAHNSKNHLNQTNVWVPWTYFSSCNLNFGFGV